MKGKGERGEMGKVEKRKRGKEGKGAAQQRRMVDLNGGRCVVVKRLWQWFRIVEKISNILFRASDIAV